MNRSRFAFPTTVDGGIPSPRPSSWGAQKGWVDRLNQMCWTSPVEGVGGASRGAIPWIPRVFQQWTNKTWPVHQALLANLKTFEKTNQPRNSLCLHPIKGYQMHKIYICTSALRNSCDAGDGRAAGDNKEKYHMHLFCSFALPLWSSHTIRSRIPGWTGPSSHPLEVSSCL